MRVHSSLMSQATTCPLSGSASATCPCRKLKLERIANSNVLMVQAAQDRHRKHAAECPHLSRYRCVLVQRQMRATLIVVSLIRPKHVPKMPFPKDDHVVKAIPSDRSDEPLRISVLPWRSRRDRSVAYAHGTNAPNEDLSIGRIPVANEILRRLLPAAGFRQLLCDPLRIRMRRHTQPHQLPARMPQDQ